MTSMPCTTYCIQVVKRAGQAADASEVWQARIDRGLAAELRADSVVLGLTSRTDIVKAALELLHRRAAEERMAQSVAKFYGEAAVPLPIGVRAARARSEHDASAS